MSQNTGSNFNPLDSAANAAANAVSKPGAITGCLVKVYKNAAVILVGLIVVGVLFSLVRDSVYKIRPFEKGLHLRGGSFIGIDEPGWHFRIPFVDTVIGVNIVERPGVIDKLDAMTADDVTMEISLLFTYRVVDPVRYTLEVTNPDQIVAGFVQGTLRDVINTRDMNAVLHSRAEINQEVFKALQTKESRYGVEFVLVQIQNASPPAEVVTAIKDKMVATQLQEKASAEAAQQRTLADSNFYTAQKKAEGDAYQITKLAEADAQRITLSADAQAAALRQMLQELDGKGTLAEQYIQVLIAQELRQNSKLIISNGGAMPVIDFREASTESQSPAALPTTAP